VDPRRPLEFGISVVPAAEGLERTRELVRAAEVGGLDLVGIQDHPYQRRFIDTWMLMATLLAETERIRIFPDVANLPLRLPAMIAKAAASLDQISGGRFELGLGAGAFWEGIAAMGGPQRSPREALEALEEAIQVIRLAWSDERSVRFGGTHYRLTDYQPGPPPAHRIEIWLGVYKPGGLNLVGRRADGWIPSLGHMPPEQLAEGQKRIDAAAEEAGRDPASVRRLYDVSGTVTDGTLGELLQGPPEHWVETLADWATRLHVDTFVFWPQEAVREQVERFAADVVPAVRAAMPR
jgi:alkanesulfonate monooxygenase SsuD/methylene tetrahydromethanopterin reductase-like flavin-dependent oxidoreductase (luciferase family)